jgi:hypothetical protein
MADHQTFRDYEDDHYDFHQYCLRRMTLSAYIESVSLVDSLLTTQLDALRGSTLLSPCVF